VEAIQTPPEATTSPMEASLDTKAEYIAYATEQAKAANLSVSEVLGTIGCESHWNPKAVSPTNDYGLSQINQPTWKFSKKTMFNPKFSIDFLIKQFKAGNASAWVCWKKLYS